MDAKRHKMTWRTVLALDLGLFNVGIITFALLPLSTLTMVEALLAAGATIALIGVLLNCRHSQNKLSQISYALSGWVGLVTFGLYQTFAPSDTPVAFRVGVGLFLLSGVASGYSAHLINTHECGGSK